MSHFQKHIFKNFSPCLTREKWMRNASSGGLEQANKQRKQREGLLYPELSKSLHCPLPQSRHAGGFARILRVLFTAAPPKQSKQTEMKIRKLLTLDKSKVDQKCLLLRRGSKGAAESKKLILSHLAPSTNRKILNLHSHSILWIFHNCSL